MRIAIMPRLLAIYTYIYMYVWVFGIIRHSPLSWHLPDRFHEIEPQMGVMELLQPTQLARKVLGPPRSTVPYPLLRENTLVLSDRLVLRRLRGRMELQVRVGDVYPNQVPYTSLLDTRICVSTILQHSQVNRVLISGILHKNQLCNICTVL